MTKTKTYPTVIRRANGSGILIREMERPELDGLEHCPYCGGHFEVPCDEPPPDTCSQALEYAYGKRTNP